MFGASVSLSGDGNTLVTGAWQEDGSATGIDGTDNDLLNDSGAVYAFGYDGGTWRQQAYVKASNTGFSDGFGISVSLSADGNTLAVGAFREDGNATGIDGDQTNDLSTDAGAVYVFTRSGDTWSQRAYIKASNTGVEDEFGGSLSLSADGNTLAVGALREDGNAAGIDGDQTNDLSTDSGAAYVFVYEGGTWRQQAYVKASNTGGGDVFGGSLSLSGDGNTLAAGALREDGNAAGIDGDQTNDLSADSGAVYVFNRSGDTWSQRAYVKASNTGTGDEFGGSLSLSGDGNTLATGASLEDGNATGINGESDGFLIDSGAVYVGSAGP